MADYNPCKNPGCRYQIEMPYEHCSLACERAEQKYLAPSTPVSPALTMRSETPLTVREAQAVLASELTPEATRDMVIRGHGMTPL